MSETRRVPRAFGDKRERHVLPSSAMLENLRRGLFGVVTGALVAASPALADWEADLRMTSTKGPSGGPVQDMKGKAYGRGSKMRMDLETPAGPISTLVDREGRQVVSLMHAQKVATHVDANQLDGDVPACKKKDIDACLVESGYKKTGTEQANGHPCSVYEKDQKRGSNTMHLKLWMPTDIKETMMVRNQWTDSSGVTGETNLTNLKIKDQPDSLFTVPSDYRRIQGPAAGAGGRGASPGPIDPSEFQGKSPEEIREMMMKRLGQGTGSPPEGTK